jgi:hypothetical protein
MATTDKAKTQYQEWLQLPFDQRRVKYTLLLDDGKYADQLYKLIDRIQKELKELPTQFEFQTTDAELPVMFRLQEFYDAYYKTILIPPADEHPGKWYLTLNVIGREDPIREPIPVAKEDLLPADLFLETES